MNFIAAHNIINCFIKIQISGKNWTVIPGDRVDRNVESSAQNLPLPHLGNILRAHPEVLLCHGASDPAGQHPLLPLVLRHHTLSFFLSLFFSLFVSLRTRNDRIIISLTGWESFYWQYLYTAVRQHFYFAKLTMVDNGNISVGFLWKAFKYWGNWPSRLEITLNDTVWLIVHSGWSALCSVFSKRKLPPRSVVTCGGGVLVVC